MKGNFPRDDVNIDHRLFSGGNQVPKMLDTFYYRGIVQNLKPYVAFLFLQYVSFKTFQTRALF